MADLREALETAFESTPSTDTELPGSSTPTEPSPQGDGSSLETTAPTTPEPELTEAEQRARDGLGRFVKATQVDGKGQVPPGTPAAPVAAPGAPQAPSTERAPASLSPVLREQWATLPQPFREYTLKREAEVQQALNNSAEARHFAGRFMQAVQPFQQAIQVETGGDPIAAVTGLMETASRLRFGTPGEKAATVAQIVKAYGVDIETLDSALAGVAPQGQPQGVPQDLIQQAVQQQLAPIFQQAQARRAAQEQQTNATVRSEIGEFAADPKNEFFDDVRDMMADAIEVAARQGYNLTLADAYQRACMLHPEVSKVMLARQQGQSAQSLTQAAQRARAAAVSVRGAAPVGNPAPAEPSSVRDAIEAAIESHSRV